MPLLPSQLSSEHFAAYPRQARQVAVDQLPLLRRLPLTFLSLLLRELIDFDWKFPAERWELERQFRYLNGLGEAKLDAAMAAFATLRLTNELGAADWVGAPAGFSESLTAHLWATHQIDAFRTAAVDYMRHVSAAVPDPALSMHRLGIVVLGEAETAPEYPLFHKLEAHGTLFTQVQSTDGVRTLLNAVAKRAASQPAPYNHWFIDGGQGYRAQGIAHVSYGDLSPARAALHGRMQKSYESGAFDPEAFRSMLARTHAEEIGLDAGDPVLSRFQLSVLTEGSGTQVFSTTFVQWTAREALRRAQPLTLMARFASRQRERPMNELLAETQRTPEMDERGSLIDADQGAYYTWINQQRLSGADKAAFLVWFRDQALVVAPSFERGRKIADPIGLGDLVERIA